MVMHLINLNDVPTDQKCVYCGNTFEMMIESPVVTVHGYGQEILLHRSCVVAFSARILNEFEKL